MKYIIYIIYILYILVFYTCLDISFSYIAVFTHFGKEPEKKQGKAAGRTGGCSGLSTTALEPEPQVLRAPELMVKGT